MNPLKILNNECRKTRHLLALSAGNDVDAREVVGLERHLAVCPQCRELQQELRHSQQILEAVQPAGAMADQDFTSVWSGVSRQIRRLEQQPTSHDWRNWMPTLTLAAACLALMVGVVMPMRPSGGSSILNNNNGIMSGPLPTDPIGEGVRPQKQRPTSYSYYMSNRDF
ncbi:MAG: zf-HC2 domain-containing protein [Planctomycetes bacterium]|nr:zf-HC2 domain-containing protein [Planctomycetota bacterium]